MKKKKIEIKIESGNMLIQKTNEDFNKKQPAPSDFKPKNKINKETNKN